MLENYEIFLNVFLMRLTMEHLWTVDYNKLGKLYEITANANWYI